MKILGIHDGHNSSACLLNNEKLLCAFQEERFTYVKNAGGFPVESVNYINKNYDLSDVDYIILAGRQMSTNWTREFIIESYRNARSPLELLKTPLKSSRQLRKLYSRIKNISRSKRFPPCLKGKKFVALDHHYCHASSAYFGLGDYENEVLIVTCDGNGDGLSATASIGYKGEITKKISISEESSIGRLYSYITYLFNMVPLEHEFKIMGLAPYCGDKKRIQLCLDEINNLFKWNDDFTEWKYNGNSSSISTAHKEISSIFQNYRFDVVAAALQLFIEETLQKWIISLSKKYNIKKVAAAGGVFMNVKSNHLIAENCNIKDFFVFPSCGDETNCIGASWSTLFKLTSKKPEPLQNFYLGDTLIPDKLTSSSPNWKSTKLKDINEKIADLIYSGEIVARVSGRMEFGARSLGNRALLANPSSTDSIRVINDMIKGRDFWMPFAPSILDEDFHLAFQYSKVVSTYNFMMYSLNSNEEYRDKLIAGLHPYDYSGRPNVVTMETNPNYFNLLKQIKRRTGIGAVLNTSFNLHGFPLVRTEEQIIHVFENSELKFIAINDYLIEKIN